MLYFSILYVYGIHRIGAQGGGMSLTEGIALDHDQDGCSFFHIIYIYLLYFAFVYP